jgi:hypothetical protein
VKLSFNYSPPSNTDVSTPIPRDSSPNQPMPSENVDIPEPETTNSQPGCSTPVHNYEPEEDQGPENEVEMGAQTQFPDDTMMMNGEEDVDTAVEFRTTRKKEISARKDQSELKIDPGECEWIDGEFAGAG